MTYFEGHPRSSTIVLVESNFILVVNSNIGPGTYLALFEMYGQMVKLMVENLMVKIGTFPY